MNRPPVARAARGNADFSLVRTGVFSERCGMVTKADLLKHGFQEIYLLKGSNEVEPWAVAGLKYEMKRVKRIEDLDFIFLPPGQDIYGGAIEGVNTTYRPLTDDDLNRMSIKGGKLFMVWTPNAQ